jgi:hypothetical protein
MVDIQIILSALWIALMLTYLLGDVLRIFSGDSTAGKMGNVQFTQGMWLGIAVLMLIPIVLVGTVPGVAPPSQSVGQHYRCQLLFPFQPGWVAHLPFSI